MQITRGTYISLGVSSGLLPALKLFVNDFALGKEAQISREVVQLFTLG